MLKQLLLTIAIVFIGLLAYSKFNGAGRTEQRASVFERVQKSGVLRCGYNIEEPDLQVDPNTGKIFGIAPDIVERMAQLLGWKVEWTEQVGWSEMTAGLQADRYDLVCVGKWVFASETRGGAFTMPIFYTAVDAYGRADETRFDDKLGNLNSPEFSIATIDGEFNDYTAKDKFPKAQRVELPALADPGSHA
jgi:polar amino acid transport system substrate-binding protein